MAWGALLAAAIAAGASIWSAHKSSKDNKNNAKFQAAQNKKLLDEQLEYNKPKNQMARYQEAGLNSHLIYGQGSPGNQASPLSYPDIKPTDYSAIGNAAAGAIPAYNQTRLADAQVQATNATTMQKNALTELNKMQARVLEKNPLLDDAGFKATIDGLKATAMLKEEQTKGTSISNFINEAAAGHSVNKIFQEVKILEQRFNLGQQDSAIKAEILKGKEFQNAIAEVQQKFLTDGDISPGQILQFIQLLLLKAL